MQMNLQQGLTPSVIHAPIVSIGACPVICAPSVIHAPIVSIRACPGMIVSIKPMSTFAGEDQETIGA